MAEPDLKKRSFSNFGFSTILIAFVMICIVTFSVLSLLTASADYKLSQKVAQKSTSHAKAEYAAYEVLAQIDTVLKNSYVHCPDKSDYRAQAVSDLRQYVADHQTLQIQIDSSGKITFQTTVDPNETLQVALQVCSPDHNSGHFYQLLRWQTDITTPERTDDSTLHLFGT